MEQRSETKDFESSSARKLRTTLQRVKTTLWNVLVDASPNMLIDTVPEDFRFEWQSANLFICACRFSSKRSSGIVKLCWKRAQRGFALESVTLCQDHHGVVFDAIPVGIVAYGLDDKDLCDALFIPPAVRVHVNSPRSP